MSPRNAKDGLSAGAFAGLLARLDADPERAGLAYETLRRALISFFTWRGAATPEECADESLDRLAARLDEGVHVLDLPRFAHGIARLVLLEHWRRPDAGRALMEEVGAVCTITETPDDDALHECLDRCLAELPPEGRKLILEYYVAQGRNRIDTRKAMAKTLGLSESALRNRAQRLRDRLEDCIARCLGGSAGEPAAPPDMDR